MEKNVKVSILCELYGKMLTQKQYIFLEDYYNNDLSLSEIAENNNITRQAVRDIIKQGENKLFEFEEKLEFMKKLNEQEKQIANILEELETLGNNTQNKEIKNSLENIKEKLKKTI